MEGTSVRFTLNLKERGLVSLLDKPRLTGSIRDNFDDGGMKGLATIDGARIGQRMHFIKRLTTEAWVSSRTLIDTVACHPLELHDAQHAHPR